MLQRKPWVLSNCSEADNVAVLIGMTGSLKRLLMTSCLIQERCQDDKVVSWQGCVGRLPDSA